MNPIVLDDTYIENLISNPTVRDSFPALEALQRQLRSKKAGCMKCGGYTHEITQLLNRGKEFVIGLPASELNRLKGVLGIPPARQFLLWRTVGGRRLRTVR